LTFRL